MRHVKVRLEVALVLIRGLGVLCHCLEGQCIAVEGSSGGGDADVAVRL